MRAVGLGEKKSQLFQTFKNFCDFFGSLASALIPNFFNSLENNIKMTKWNSSRLKILSRFFLDL